MPRDAITLADVRSPDFLSGLRPMATPRFVT